MREKLKFAGGLLCVAAAGALAPPTVVVLCFHQFGLGGVGAGIIAADIAVASYLLRRS